MAEKYSALPEEGGIITEQLLKNLNETEPNESNAYKELIVAKVVSMLVLGLVSFLIGLIPLQLAKWFNWKFNSSHSKNGNNLVISLLLCFGGGVLMFTTFLHLQPEIREEMNDLMEKGKAPHFEQLADLVFCVGFFFVYLIEEVVHGILDRKHNHTDDDACLHRSVSLRRCAKKEQNADQNHGIIPRVSLVGTPDGKPLDLGPKSNSTQVLIDSTPVHNGNDMAFEQNFPKSKFSAIDAELTAAKYGLYNANKANAMDSNRKEFHQSDEKPSSNGHSHMPTFYDDDFNGSGRTIDLKNTFRGFFTVLALSFHAVFEGLAVGLENEVSNVWYLFLAIATHKFVISFCVGIDLLSTKTRLMLIALYVGTFAFVSPLGIGIGIALSNDPMTSSSDLSSCILQGMAAGTLLYVVFFEVLQRERANEQSGILQLIAILAGFGVMFALQFVTGHHHHNSHGENFDVSHLLESSHVHEERHEHQRHHLHGHLH